MSRERSQWKKRTRLSRALSPQTLTAITERAGIVKNRKKKAPGTEPETKTWLLATLQDRGTGRDKYI